MADVSLVIALRTPESPARITSVVWSAPEANVSNTSRLSSTGYKGFFLSPEVNKPNSLLNGSYKFFGEYQDEDFPGYVSKQLSDSLGNFSVDVTLRVQDTFDFSLGYITFDPSTGEYASLISVNGVDYSNNEVRFYFIIPKNAVEVSIVLKKWSAPYKNAKITDLGIGTGSVEVAKHLTKLTYSQNTVPDSETISPGIVEQYLEASFYDPGRLFECLYQMNELTEGLEVTISRMQKNGIPRKIGTYLSEKWDFDVSTQVVDLICSDYTKMTESTQAEAWPLASRKFSSVNADDTTSVRAMLLADLKKMTGKRSLLLTNQAGLTAGSLIFPKLYKPEQSVNKTIKDICMTVVSTFFWDGNSFVFRRLY